MKAFVPEAFDSYPPPIVMEHLAKAVNIHDTFFSSEEYFTV